MVASLLVFKLLIFTILTTHICFSTEAMEEETYQKAKILLDYQFQVDPETCLIPKDKNSREALVKKNMEKYHKDRYLAHCLNLEERAKKGTVEASILSKLKNILPVSSKRKEVKTLSYSKRINSYQAPKDVFPFCQFEITGKLEYVNLWRDSDKGKEECLNICHEHLDLAFIKRDLKNKTDIAIKCFYFGIEILSMKKGVPNS